MSETTFPPSTFLSLALSLTLCTQAFAAPAPAGIKPTGADDRPLNLDLEDGTLKDWKVEGSAFGRQPIKGDTVARRRDDMKSNHAGEYWIGTYEIAGDDPTGTLTSVPFKVTHPFASFLIGGGSTELNRVELVRADTKQAFFKVSGFDAENMRPAVVDLQPHLGKEIFVRVIDHQIGAWGHINFDDFKFFAARPALPNEITAAELARQAEVPPADVVKYAGLSPEEAAKAITLPPGFSARLFAGEPDVKQPIAFAIDDRARLWVAEAYTYPRRAPEGQGKDRILIFEDTDGDGRFNKRTVFMEGLNLVSGLEVGFGGVWVGAAPYLMFIPDKDGDDKPDGPPEILLDGWDFRADTHETLNTFTWGPDGWLYGCHGVFCPSNVGKPGAPASERQWVDAAVWRYHPTKHRFEVFAEGASNQWGVDFDDYGQCFIEACVIPHLWHMIQGGRYQRQGGEHYAISLEEIRRNERARNPNSRKPTYPFFYDDIKTIGDHVHWAGSKGPHAANARSDSAGGGHAHAGLMVYLGDSFPADYRGKLFMNNIHGQRINMDIPERRGSGFVGKHGADFANFNDTWSQTMNLLYDQNGSVYVIDWYDKNQCHHNNVEGHDRSNGRIFKIVYGDTKWTPVDLQKKSDDELVQLQLHPNDWYVRHARRLLQERGPNPKVHEALLMILSENPDVTRRLRALWALHVTGGLTEKIALAQLDHANEYIRAWAIQLMMEDRNPSAALLKELARLAKSDPSPFVRLYVAAALQRTPVNQRLEVLEGLLAHAEDSQDHNLPLMYWYATEPVVAQDMKLAVALMTKTKIPLVRQFITRRMASSDKVASAGR
ncbi:MAG: dehydrogenase [Verrucomicrobia bacterium]|nr:dehydrogenase [Verrucomicrobiota bacterium]